MDQTVMVTTTEPEARPETWTRDLLRTLGGMLVRLGEDDDASLQADLAQHVARAVGATRELEHLTAAGDERGELLERTIDALQAVADLLQPPASAEALSS